MENKELSTKNIAIINGRQTIFCDGLLAFVKNSGKLEYIREYRRGDTVYCKVKRKGESIPTKRSFSLEEAKTAGLIEKDIWKKYPRQMMRMRARYFAIRDAFTEYYSLYYSLK